jgi:hypothetical protein
LLSELDNTIKGEKIFIRDQEGYLSEVAGQKRMTDPAIARIKDELGVTYAEIRDALSRLINDKGLENQALAKKIELVIDDNLSAGYRTVDGIEVPADDMYLSAKKFVKDMAELEKQAAGEVIVREPAKRTFGELAAAKKILNNYSTKSPERIKALLESFPELRGANKKAEKWLEREMAKRQPVTKPAATKPVEPEAIKPELLPFSEGAVNALPGETTLPGFNLKGRLNWASPCYQSLIMYHMK